MILDLPRFVKAERPHWTALDKTLDWLERNPASRLSIEEAERLLGYKVVSLSDSEQPA